MHLIVYIIDSNIKKNYSKYKSLIKIKSKEYFKNHFNINMSQDSELITSALLAFFSTTMDDFAVMLIFFGRVNIEMTDQLKLGYLKVIIGQTIGFSILVFISFSGLLIGTIVPTEYIDIIGLFPLIAGFLNFHELSKEEGWYELKCLKLKETVDVEVISDKKTTSIDSVYSIVPVCDEEGNIIYIYS
jgi:cadmium resistance protein CadD (predicted permease)